MRHVLLLLALVVATPALACGPDSDCVLGDRLYRLSVPEGDGPHGALLYAHGYRGTAEGGMRNKALERLAHERGLALVALEGVDGRWQIAHHPGTPDMEQAQEYGYVDAVLDDLATRMDLDPDRIVMTGFSAGGMMAWTIACGASERFRGFVPMSGTFWSPVPESCPAPPRSLVHIHGTEDGTVPLSGRPIGGTSQGDVATALDMYRAEGDFEPDGRVEAAGDMSCEQSTNDAGLRLDFCTFPGGHGFSTERLGYGLDRVLGGA